MSNDGEYREVIKRFYEVYRPLQKRHNLRLHSHFSIYDGGYGSTRESSAVSAYAR